MSSILISFHLDIPKCIIEDIFEEQHIVPFKDKTYKSVVYHELSGVVSRYVIEAPYGQISEIRENFVNLPEVRSVYLCEETGGVKRTYRRKSFEDKKNR